MALCFVNVDGEMLAVSSGQSGVCQTFLRYRILLSSSSLSLNVSLKNKIVQSVLKQCTRQGEPQLSQTDSSERKSCCLYSILQMHFLSIFTCCFVTILTFYVYYLM